MAKQNTDQVKEEQVQQPQADDQVQDANQQLEDRVKALEDQLKRAVADYQNLEKRVAEGRSELTNWTTSELLRKILPVMDHLEKALLGMSDEDKQSGWAKGVVMAVGELKNVLLGEGLEQIVADGQFDPNLHEAVDMEEGEHDKVLQVLEHGYKLRGKILRPAKVVVGRKI